MCRPAQMSPSRLCRIVADLIPRRGNGWGASLVSARNEPSTLTGNDFLETLWLAIPLGGTPLTFLPAYLPGGGDWWWLLRVIVVSSVGLLVASFIAASGAENHDSRNAGWLGAPVYSRSIRLLALLPLTVLAAAVIGKGTGQGGDNGAWCEFLYR